MFATYSERLIYERGWRTCPSYMIWGVHIRSHTTSYDRVPLVRYMDIRISDAVDAITDLEQKLIVHLDKYGNILSSNSSVLMIDSDTLEHGSTSD